MAKPTGFGDSEGEDSGSAPEATGESAPRFGSWRAFLFVAIAVNGLYLWGMLGQMGQVGIDAWTKALAWLPFNFITTVLYAVFLMKLGRGPAGPLFNLLSLAMIALNWIVFFAA